MTTGEKKDHRRRRDRRPVAAGGTARGTAVRFDPAALTVEQLARLLVVPAEKIRIHVAAGVPVTAGGRINLVHYAAWLNRELGRRNGD